MMLRLLHSRIGAFSLTFATMFYISTFIVYSVAQAHISEQRNQRESQKLIELTKPSSKKMVNTKRNLEDERNRYIGDGSRPIPSARYLNSKHQKARIWRAFGSYLFYGMGVIDPGFQNGWGEVKKADCILTDFEIPNNSHPYNGQMLYIPILAMPMVFAARMPQSSKQIMLDRAIICDIYELKIKHWNDRRISSLNPSIADFPIFPYMTESIINDHWPLSAKTAYLSHEPGVLVALFSFLAERDQNWLNSFDLTKSLTQKSRIRSDDMISRRFFSLLDGEIGSLQLVSLPIYNLMYNKPSIHLIQIANTAGAKMLPTSENVNTTVINDLTKLKSGKIHCSIASPKCAGYPIVSYIYMTIPAHNKDARSVQRLSDYIEWLFDDGSLAAKDMGYFELPKVVQSWVKKQIHGTLEK